MSADVTKDLLEFVKEWLECQGGDNNYMTAKARAAIARAEAALAEPQPDADGWIPWAGGYCQPRRMPPDTRVSVKLRCGVVITQNCGSLNWEHDDDPSDILAYRIVRK